VLLTDRRGDRASAVPPSAPAPGTASATGSQSEWIAFRTRELVDAISGPHVRPGVALLALLGALLLGAVHALSPGHGKTIVGAYLVGSRGTPRHAVFLGLTVTVTHTIGVFVLGFATLYASRYVVPERLFPILSLTSAVLVLSMGLILLVQRSRAARQALWKATPARSSNFRFVQSDAAPVGARGLVFAPTAQFVDTTMHSHGGGPMHSHLPPGAAGEKISWRSLLALGVSGGLVPCPSAMVLLLAAVALNKTAYGMLLVVAFSIGLAITLTVVGLAFLYARNRFRSPTAGARWAHLVPVLSAAAISLIGIALCVGALRSFNS
jgi:ABC-type nickel/cobalt efflux system permease component RcnA